MLLPEKNGIRCDLCASAHRDKFVYYSIEDLFVTISNGKSIGSKKGALNCDVCNACYDNMIERCKKFLAPKAIPNKIKCDFCVNSCSGSFSYHSLRLSKVSVDIAQEKPSNVSKNVMDFNINECCYKELNDKVNNLIKKTKNEGVWS